MRTILTATLALLVSAAAASAALDVPLTVSEPAGVARSEVVSGGIPLPEGQYKDPAAFSLFDGDKEVPVQVDPIVKFPDGSLHWVLVSFPVELKANEKKVYTLRDTPGKAAAANPVVVKEDGGKVTLSNGLVGFTVNKEQFNGFESISVGGKEVFKVAAAGLTLAGRPAATKPIAFDLRYRGPVRTTLWVKARYGEKANPSYAMAITLNAGEPTIRLEHNLRNGAAGAATTQIESSEIRLAPAGDLKAEKNGLAAVAPAAFGWQSFSGGADLLVFMRHGGPGNGGAYRIGLAGDLAINLNPNPSGPYRLAFGAHKISEIDLAFGGKQTVDALASPLHALAPCAWYSQQDGLGAGRGFGSLEDETATYKAMGLKKFDDPRKMPQEHTGRPAMYCQTFDAHFTSECDHLQGLMLGYVRTGQRGYLDQALAWSRYWTTYLNYRSDEFEYGKEGKFPTPKWGDGSNRGRVCSEGCHFYGVGIFDFALITGKIDALEAAIDVGEFANVCWYGQYSGKKPGDHFSTYGSRGFTRCYLAIARSYDVMRDEKFKAALLHYIAMGTRTPARDPRGFTIGGVTTPAGAAGTSAKSTGIKELIAAEGVTFEGNLCVHPKYGKYQPKSVGTWPEAMELMANLVAWESLSGSKDPACQVAAEDAMDYAIAEAWMGATMGYDSVQKAVHYYLIVDYPLPGYVPVWKGEPYKNRVPNGTDSWYTKWWPAPLAAGYKLTGDKKLRDLSLEVAWWGLSRDYVNPPSVPEGEAPSYARVEGNTKGDWNSPVALAFGYGARPLKDITPPAAVSDLAAKALGGGKVELTWTEPKADGKLAIFQLKHSAKPIKDYLEINYATERGTVTYWNMASNVAGEPTPTSAGGKQTMTVTVPVGKRSFAMKVFDADHRISPLGNVVEVEVTQ